MKKHYVWLILPLSLFACSTSVKQPPIVAASKQISFSNHSAVKTRLNQQLANWRGVKYKLGGLSKSGVDCSGFVYLTYLSRFGIKLPRSTELQAALGKKVARKNLRVGDLIFFKTGIFQKHVGIYLGKGEFIHASTSIGVTKSRLDNVYWADKYWKAKRVKV